MEFPEVDFAPRFFEEYHASKELVANIDQYCGIANGFYTLLMAAMRLAGSGEMAALEHGFPQVAKELRLRYNARGGALNQAEFQVIYDRANQERNSDYDPNPKIVEDENEQRS